jgi:hypothetical protein
MHFQRSPSADDEQAGLDGPRTTIARARAGYDVAFERALAEAITAAVFATSHTTNANYIAIRTAETASALLTVLAGFLAMSPAAARSPTAIRRTVDVLGKRLRRRVAAAQSCPDMAEFLRRCFRDDDVGGHA